MPISEDYLTSPGLQALIEKFKEGRSIVPVCGAGFSKQITNAQVNSPTWSDLTGTLKSNVDCSAQTDRIEAALKASDYLTALTLIRHCAPQAFDTGINDLFQYVESLDLTQEFFPVHMGLWCVGFPLVVTTNFDNFFSKARPRAKVLTYQNDDAQRIINEIRDLKRRDPVIFHAHGQLNGEQSSTHIPLLTWREYFLAYGIDETTKERLQNLLLSEAEPILGSRSAFANYAESLDFAMSEAWMSLGNDRAAQTSTRLSQILDDLFTNHTLLLVGFSFDDPIWRSAVAQHANYTNWQHFYISNGTDKSRNMPGFTPIPVANWDQLYSLMNFLAYKVHEGEFGGAEMENRSRERGYAALGQQYHDANWIFQNNNTLIPFVELWANPGIEDALVSVSVESQSSWRLDPKAQAIREKYYKFREAKAKAKGTRLVNEYKVRVNSWRSTPQGIDLNVEPVEYKDFLFTNHVVANLGEAEMDAIAKFDAEFHADMNAYFSSEGKFNPRTVLCGDMANIALTPGAKCSNHLGISALIVGDFHLQGGEKVPVIFCPPSTNQISSPNDVVPSVSGSVDWPMRSNATSEGDIFSMDDVRRNTGLLDIGRELKREFMEECRFNVLSSVGHNTLGYQHGFSLMAGEYDINYLMSHQVLLNLCQNIERGGKPELFYLYLLREQIGMNVFLSKYFEPNWELEKLWTPIFDKQDVAFLSGTAGIRKIFLFQSPIGADLTLHSDYKESISIIGAILRSTKYNPVLRAHLASLLLFTLRRYPEIASEVWTDLAPGLSH